MFLVLDFLLHSTFFGWCDLYSKATYSPEDSFDLYSTQSAYNKGMFLVKKWPSLKSKKTNLGSSISKTKMAASQTVTHVHLFTTVFEVRAILQIRVLGFRDGPGTRGQWLREKHQKSKREEAGGQPWALQQSYPPKKYRGRYGNSPQWEHVLFIITII